MSRTPAIVAIIAAFVVVVIGAAYLCYFSTQFMVTDPPAFTSKIEEWPEPLQRLAESKSEFAQSVLVFKHDAFVDQKSVSLVNGHSDSIDLLIQNCSLEPATEDHPMLPLLFELKPENWPVDLASSKLYATTKYGSVYQEGPDLLLLVRDDQADTTIILHERIF